MLLFCLVMMPLGLAAQLSASESQQLMRSIGELRTDLNALERKNESLEHRNQKSLMFALLCFGVFCAHWAMMTGRNPWLWFFLGAVFSILAGIEILYLTRRMLKRHIPHPVSREANRVPSPQ